MTMMAFDADDPATDNAALRYNIVRQSPGNPSSNMFYIDAERGDIVTAIPAMLLDREVGQPSWAKSAGAVMCSFFFFFCHVSLPPSPPVAEARQRGMIASAAG